MGLPDKVLEALRAGAPAAGTSEHRGDGWSNILTGLGTTRDKRTGGSFAVCPVSDAEARQLWEGDDLAAHAIETYPDEMLRAGYKVCVTPEDETDGDAARELGADMGKALTALGVDEAFRTALCYERAYGGAAVFPVTNDGVGDLAMPLNESSITDVKRLVVFEPAELIAESLYVDPTRPDYGRPATYRLQPYVVQGAAVTVGTVIHESRLIIFPGIQVSRLQRTKGRIGWGGSVLTRINEVLRDFNLGFGGASHLLNDFAQAVMSINGLKEILASPNGLAMMQNRMQVMEMMRSSLRMLVVDAGAAGSPAETFKREATPMSGLPEMLDRLIDRLAAALEEPASRFMKQAPGGLNPGDSETKWFYDRVSQKQDKHLRPRLQRLVRLVFLSHGGPTGGEVPESWDIDFEPLWTPSAKEEADTKKVNAETDAIYLGAGVFSPLDVVRSRFGPDGYSDDVHVDIAEIEAMQKAELAPAPKVAAKPADPNAPQVDAPGNTADRAG